VIGTGASAIQLIPEIAPQVAQLTVYQRSPPWVLPRHDAAVSPAARWAFAHVPGLLRLVRAWHYWRAEAIGLGLVSKPKLMGRGQKASAAYKEREIAAPALRLKLNPFYTLGCKRILISDDFYATMTRPNVELVTDAIREVRPGSIVAADGRERPCDAIVFATGFDAFNASAGMTIRGRGGRTLAADWADGPEGYLGVAVSGYPNLFTIMDRGPGAVHRAVHRLAGPRPAAGRRSAGRGAAGLERRPAAAVQTHGLAGQAGGLTLAAPLHELVSERSRPQHDALAGPLGRLLAGDPPAATGRLPAADGNRRDGG